MRRPIPQRLLTSILLGVCVVINIFIQQVSIRLDFSNGKAYSVSQASSKVIQSLKKPVAITFFSSKNIPSTLRPVRQDVDDFLREYSSQGGGKKIQYQLKDPDNDEKVQKEMQSYSIPRLQFSQQDQDQFALQNAYFGVGVSYDGKHASLPQVTDIRDLEYNLTSVLYKLSVPSLPEVGVIGAPGGLTQLQTLTSASRSQFSIEESASVSGKFKSMMIFGSDAKTFDDAEITQIKNYLNGGGSAIFFVDGVTVSEALLPQNSTHNLFALLRSLGVDLQKNLVLSRAAELVSFGQSQSLFPTVLPYPYWIKTNEFTKDSLLSNVTALVFPWSSTVKMTKDDGILVRSEQQSWVEAKDYKLSPQEVTGPKNGREQSFPLISRGTIGKGSFVVIPTSRFVQDGYLSRTNDNLELVLNILSEFTSGGLLTGIRSRSVEYYPLPQYIEPIKNVIKYGQILAGPMIVSLLGLIILFKRSRSK